MKTIKRMTHLQIEDFDLGQMVGRGGFAQVYRAIHRENHQEYAIKVIHKPNDLDYPSSSSSSPQRSRGHSGSTKLTAVGNDEKRVTPSATKLTDEQLKQRRQQLQRIANEMEIHPHLQHRNIVKCYNTFEDDIYAYLLLEYCEGESLYRYLKRQPPSKNEHSTSSLGALPEYEAVYIIRELLHALEYLHGQGVIHRDLKLSNILLVPLKDIRQNDNNGLSVQSSAAATPIRSIKYNFPNNMKSPSSSPQANFFSSSIWVPPYEVKLCDFGLATYLAHPDEEHYTLCGTPNYIAPEIVEQKFSHSYSADIWSLGCLFYTLVIGTPPFEQASVQETLQSIVKGDYDKKENQLSKDALSFMRLLLQLNPKERPNVGAILSHPLLANEYKKNTHQAVNNNSVDGYYNNNGSLATTAVLSCGSPSIVSKDSQNISSPTSTKSKQSPRDTGISSINPSASSLVPKQADTVMPTIKMPKPLSIPENSKYLQSVSSSAKKGHMVQRLQNLLSFDQGEDVGNEPDFLNKSIPLEDKHSQRSMHIDNPRGMIGQSREESDAVLFRESIDKRLQDLHPPGQSKSDPQRHVSHSGGNQKMTIYELEDSHYGQLQSSKVSLERESELRSSLSTSTTSWSTAIHELRNSFDNSRHSPSKYQQRSSSNRHKSHSYNTSTFRPTPMHSRRNIPLANSSPSHQQNLSGHNNSHIISHDSNSNKSIQHQWMDIMNCMREVSSFLLITKRQEILLFTRDCKLFYCQKISASSSVKEAESRSEYLRLLFSAEKPHELQLGYMNESMANGLINDLLDYLSQNQSQSSEDRIDEKHANTSRKLDVNDIKEVLHNLISKEHIFRHNIHIYSNASSLPIHRENDNESSSRHQHYFFSYLSEASFTKSFKFHDIPTQSTVDGNIGNKDPSQSFHSSADASLSSLLKSIRFGNCDGDRHIETTDPIATRKKFPKTLNKAIEKIATLMKGIRCRIPKMILYLSNDKVQSSLDEKDKLSMKCMLMCNSPLPDFHLQWSDGTRLVYILQSSMLSIFKPPMESLDNHGQDAVKALRWDGQLSLQALGIARIGGKQNEVMLPSIPEVFHPYLIQSQAALQRCLKHGKVAFSVENNVNGRTGKSATVSGDYLPAVFPIVIVDDLNVSSV